ncbi:MAG: hypothetical protein WD607_02895 [Candidatus Paceibacterota bacterium]
MKKNVILKTAVKIILVFLFVYFANEWYENRYHAFEKNYVVGELGKTYRIYWQGTSIDFNFNYYGKSNKASNYLGTNKLKSKKYLIEVPIKDIKKSRILWDYPVPDTLKAPFEAGRRFRNFWRKGNLIIDKTSG